MLKNHLPTRRNQTLLQRNATACQPASHSHNSRVEPLSSLSNQLGAQGWVSLLPITAGATLAQGSMQAQSTAGCPQHISVSHTCPCSFCSSSRCVESRLSQWHSTPKAERFQVLLSELTAVWQSTAIPKAPWEAAWDDPGAQTPALVARTRPKSQHPTCVSSSRHLHSSFLTCGNVF